MGYECINGTYRTLNTTKGKPEVELQVINKNIYVDENAFFTCKVRANPAAEIFWLYEGRFITREEQRKIYSYSDCNTTLTITFAEPKDTGRYSCMARNSYGEMTSNLTILAVQQKEKFKKVYKAAEIEMISTQSCAPEHENMTLKCRHKKSQGICLWERNNSSINEEKISYCDDRMCCLNINRFSKEDAGLYTCFMYYDVLKADVLIPQPDAERCNNIYTKEILVDTVRERGNSTGEGSKNKSLVGVWLYGMIALSMTVPWHEL
ncbi:obscurin-like protein 1 isoform X2 [Dendronephthya gigantea]|nr:obscurin-like protein 1 isoform X2 [Dendronephthya gigantea]